jgi:hypothetical protein
MNDRDVDGAMPRVVNRYRDEGVDGVYIGRPSKWGNPFRIGPDGDREAVIAKYRAFLVSRPDLVDAVRRELAGRNLVCFCAPKACHGDVLLEIANGPAAAAGLRGGGRDSWPLAPFMEGLR